MSTFVLNVMLAHLTDVTVSFQIYSHMMKIKFEKSQRNPYPLPLFVWVVSRAIFLRYFFSQFFFDKLESIFVHPNRLDFRCPIDGACAWIHHLLLFLFAFFYRAASKNSFMISIAIAFWYFGWMLWSLLIPCVCELKALQIYYYLWNQKYCRWPIYFKWFLCIIHCAVKDEHIHCIILQLRLKYYSFKDELLHCSWRNRDDLINIFSKCFVEQCTLTFELNQSYLTSCVFWNTTSIYPSGLMGATIIRPQVWSSWSAIMSVITK